MAAEIEGTLTTCAVIDVYENVTKSKVKIVVEVAGPRRASNYRKNTIQIFERAVIASNATKSELISSEAYEGDNVVTTTTTVRYRN